MQEEQSPKAERLNKVFQIIEGGYKKFINTARTVSLVDPMEGDIDQNCILWWEVVPDAKALPILRVVQIAWRNRQSEPFPAVDTITNECEGMTVVYLKDGRWLLVTEGQV